MRFQEGEPFVDQAKVLDFRFNRLPVLVRAKFVSVSAVFFLSGMVY